MTLGALAVVGLVVAVVTVAMVRAQTSPGEPDQPVIRVSVNRVQLEVQTTDSKGHHVTDLRAEDFEILDNGKPQKITNCSYVRLEGGTAAAQTVATTASRPESHPPIPSHELAREQVQRTIVLLVDDESFKPETVPYVRKALKTIIEQQIEPRDLVALVRTTSGEGALDQFTSDKDLLLASAERVRWKPMGRGSPGMESISDGSRITSPYLVRRSINLSLNTIRNVISALRDQPGKKAVFLISQSLPASSIEWFYDRNFGTPTATEIGRLIDSAARAGVAIYSIDASALSPLTPGADYSLTEAYKGVSGAGGGPPGAGTASLFVQTSIAAAHARLELNRTGLRLLAQGTGGLMIADTNDIAHGVSRFFDDLNGCYLMAYKPDSELFFGTKEGAPPLFHRVKVRVKRRGLTVRTYAGYVGREEDMLRTNLREQEQMRNALFSPFSARGVRLHLTPVFAMHMAEKPEIDLLLHINARDLSFAAEAGGIHRAALELVARTVDEQGKPADIDSKTVTVQLTDARFQRAMQRGLLYETSIPVPHPGFYEVRVVVSDSGGKLGSARRYLDIPDLKTGHIALAGLLVFNAKSSDTESEAPGVPAVRIFRRQDILSYNCQVFNAKQVEMEIRAFREGKPIIIPQTIAPSVDATATAEPGLSVKGAVSLSTLEPGDYVLQLVVHGKSVKGESGTASQWTDFEVIPQPSAARF